jgi:hypothetical protein
VHVENRDPDRHGLDLAHDPIEVCIALTAQRAIDDVSSLVERRQR